jgi:hypothetical protein
VLQESPNELPAALRSVRQTKSKRAKPRRPQRQPTNQNRSVELTRKVNETLVPKLEKLSGFQGYYLIDAGNGVFSSLGLFETPEQGMESTKLVTTWIREEKLDTILPNEPKITSGKIVAHSDRVLVTP